MKDNEKLQQCFEPLVKDLYKIEHTPELIQVYGREYVIDEIKSGGIFGCNLEDCQQYLYHHLKVINELIIRIPTLIKEKEISDRTVAGENPFEQVIVTSDDIKKNLELSVFEILTFYQTELRKILVKIEFEMESLGSDRFANAGFKIKLNLSVEEIGALFNALFENSIISSKRQDGSVLTKIDLARFISRNFSSKRRWDLSQDAVENVINRSNPGAENTVSKSLAIVTNFLS